jgi:hypothetical protein
MSMHDARPLLKILPLLLVGLIVAEVATSSGKTDDALIGSGYKPGICKSEPPAELLALSDWPADDGDGCLGGSAASIAKASASAAASAAAMVEVVEARVRPVREVLVAGLREDRLQDQRINSEAAATETAATYGDLDTGGTPPPRPESLAEANAAVEAAPYGDLEAPSAPAAASPSAQAAAPGLLASARVEDGRLDKLRGGFVGPGGLNLTFGIERVVYVNGVLQSTTALRVEDLGRLHGGSAGTVAVLPPGSTVAVIQNGGGNAVAANALPASTLGTEVQNSLNNQNLQTVTTINATVNSLQSLQGLRMQHSMQEALNRATLLR